MTDNIEQDLVELRAEWAIAKATHTANLKQMAQDIETSKLAVKAQQKLDAQVLEKMRKAHKKEMQHLQEQFNAEQQKYQTALAQLGQALNDARANADKELERIAR